MSLLFFVFYLLFIGMAMISRDNRRLQLTFYMIGGWVIMLLAFTIDRSNLPDYSEYLNNLQSVDNLHIEVSFIFIRYLVQNFFGNEIIVAFIIYALLGVGIKLVAIRRLTELSLLSLAIYLSYFFQLHDLIQIRAGVASACLLLCIKPLYDRNLRLFLYFTLFAILFHYSALIILPLWFLNPRKEYRWIYALIIPASMIAYYCGISILSLLKLIPIEHIRMKVEAYEEISIYGNSWSAASDELNPFRLWHMFRVVVYYWLLWRLPIILKYNNYALIMMKIYAIGLSFLWIGASLSIIGGRIFELLAIVEIVLWPFIYYTVKPRTIGIVLVALLGLCNLYYSIYVYEFWL